MSNFNYCSLVWHACGAKNTRKLEKLQERALRFVYLDKVSSYDDLLTKANLTTLHLGRLKMLATEVYKSVHKLNPPYIQDIYKTKTTVTNRRLRRQNNLHMPRVNSTTYGLNSLARYLDWRELSMRILQKVTLLILRVFYVLLFGIRFRIQSHSLINFYIHVGVLLSTVVFYVDYSSLWLMFLCCNIDYK